MIKRVLLISVPLFLLTLLLTGISFSVAEKALAKEEKKAEKKLLLTLTIRKKNIETYYGSVQAEVLFWANNQRIRDALKNNTANPQSIQPLLNNLSVEQGYDNILLTTPQGQLIYSANKHVTNLTSLPTQIKPILNKIQQTEKEQQKTAVYFSDYTTITSSQPHAFVAAGIFNQQTLIGILLVQLSTQPLIKLLEPLTDTHLTIQTLVIGHDKQLRHPISTMPHKIQLSALADALLVHGNQHVFTIPDQNNVPFLAAFDFARIANNVTWVIISKTDVTQATQHMREQIYKWILVGIGLLISALLIGYFGERWTRNKQEG